MVSGTRGDYIWAEWYANEYSLRHLLSDVPRLVIGKYLVNTSFDSGPLSLSLDEMARGWRQESYFTLSPRIADIDDIPFCWYDEWYVFDSPVTFGDYEVFVNYGGFSLHSPNYLEMQDKFWKQFGMIAPESYLAEGDFLIGVTKLRKLFADHLGFNG